MHRFSELDPENLAEEIDALARGKPQELRSRYAVLLPYLLKWESEPECSSHSWAAAIARERAELFAKAYRSARADAVA